MVMVAYDRENHYNSMMPPEKNEKVGKWTMRGGGGGGAEVVRYGKVA